MTPQEWDDEHYFKQDIHHSTGMTWFDAHVAAQMDMETEHGLRPKEAA